MCTSLVYTDVAGKAYFGRTLELTVSLPYQIAFFPKGAAFQSDVAGHPAVKFTRKHNVISITMPSRMPTAASPVGPDDLKIIEGLNDQGLTFSLLSYPASAGKQSVDMTQAALSASDLGGWILGNFTNVGEIRAALDAQPVLLEPLALLGGAVSPFHYVAHDATGASLVIEFNNGMMTLYDNPVGVMTNGPTFDWHLTNLNNYTFLNNVDHSTATFGTFKARQPDSGIATAGLPSSNTSVGRFVRAVYYAQFTEKAATPDAAVSTLSRIMNNFDRPRGASIAYPGNGGDNMEVKGLPETGEVAYSTEFTSWTSLTDLDRKLFLVRAYDGVNFASIDLKALSDVTETRVAPLQRLTQSGGDATAALRGHSA